MPLRLCIAKMKYNEEVRQTNSMQNAYVAAKCNQAALIKIAAEEKLEVRR